MLKNDLISILDDQKHYLIHEEKMIRRKLQDQIRWNIPATTIISGVRRSGKSTLLRQVYSEVKSKVGYLHFDDPRLVDFKVNDFYTLEELWAEKEIYQFDEIHRIAGWEQYIRHALERKKHIGITGSNAYLMSRELGTLLTGRHLTYELFPFSYLEFLIVKRMDRGLESLDWYFDQGGFPEAVIFEEPRYHTELFYDIIQRDIAVRKGIRNANDLQLIALHVLNNIARPFTYSKLAKNYSIKSVKTVSEFLSYLEDTYMIFIVPCFSFSYKKQVNNAKKVYAIDHAFARNNSTQLTKDSGRQLENMVFIQLRQKTKEIFYFQEKGECDFICRSKGNDIECIQVCLQINHENEQREINGLVEALNFFKLSYGILVTKDQEDHIVRDDIHIDLIPFWKWSN